MDTVIMLLGIGVVLGIPLLFKVLSSRNKFHEDFSDLDNEADAQDWVKKNKDVLIGLDFKEQVEKALSKNGMGKVTGQILKMHDDTEGFVPDVEGIQAIGVSKVGGMPDLKNAEDWPVKENKKLSFLLQLSLADFKSAVSEGLDEEGLILFFYDAIEQPWGSDPKDKNSWKVIYYDNKTGLKRIEAENVRVFTEHNLKKVTTFSVSPYNYGYYDKYNINGELAAWLIHEIKKLNNLPTNQFFGYPFSLQPTLMPVECQLASDGYKAEVIDEYTDKQRLELGNKASDWMLLAQIDSMEKTGMVWGMKECYIFG